MGPRLFYAFIVGTVIAAALALRLWDPAPVARMRALVFDAYQQVQPRKFDPALPVRIVDIDEDCSVCVCGKTPRVATVGAQPQLPSDEEVVSNPRARSAKLRAARRLAA